MENSMFSSQNKVIFALETDCETMDSQEESGWTQYIDDFSVYNEQTNREMVSLVSGSSGGNDGVSESMVSDAGSNPKWRQKLLKNGLPKFQNKLKFKTRKQEMISGDDSLEDTASSPVNSPKITMNFKTMNLNSRQTVDDHQNYMAGDDISLDEHSKYTFKNQLHDPRVDVEVSELRKNGLCLVPISIVINKLH